MKVKSMLATAFVLISSVTFANGSNSNKLVVIRTQESGIFKVIFEGEGQVNATISLLDEKEETVFIENVSGKNGFILPMNFKGLRSGDYQIVVKEGTETHVETINYPGYVKSVAKTSSIQNVHVAKLNTNGKYLLSINRTGNDPITISVYDGNNDLVHFETRKTEGNLAVLYDVTAITGASRFEITDKTGYSAIFKK